MIFLNVLTEKKAKTTSINYQLVVIQKVVELTSNAANKFQAYMEAFFFSFLYFMSFSYRYA